MEYVEGGQEIPVNPAHYRPIDLRHGTVCQFPTKVRNPEEKFPDHSHLPEMESLQNLHLHQGSVCQFPQKVLKTGTKFTEDSHIKEIDKLSNLHLHQGSVCQFPQKVRNPEEKLPDHSHLHEVDQLEKLHLHQGSVCQFPTKIRNPEDKYPDHPHLHEVEDNKHLHLKQGSVCQFPSNLSSTRPYDYFHPPDEPMRETLPIAQAHHPDHCLPSQARRQQAYITHPSHGTSKLVVSSLDNEGNQRSQGQSPAHQWPPVGHNNMPRKTFHPEGGPKSFMWPPPRPSFHRSFQELPTDGSKGANAWNPTQGDMMSGQPAFVPQKRQYNWPPNDYARKQAYLNHHAMSQEHHDKSRSMLELDEVMVVQPQGTVVCYRPPPWSQFYKCPYYGNNDNQY